MKLCSPTQHCKGPGISPRGKRKILLVNKRDRGLEVTIEGAAGGPIDHDSPGGRKNSRRILSSSAVRCDCGDSEAVARLTVFR
jgi:hypothetical protein